LSLQEWRQQQKWEINKHLEKIRKYMEKRAKHLCPICNEKMEFIGIRPTPQKDKDKSWLRCYRFQKVYFCYNCKRPQIYSTNKEA